MVKGVNDIGEASTYTCNGLGYLVQNIWDIKKNAYGCHDVQPAAVVDGEAVIDTATGKKDKKEKKKPEEVAASPELNKTSTVIKDFLPDYTRGLQEVLWETEQDGLTYRYGYGQQRLSVTIDGVTNGAGDLLDPNGKVKLYYHQDYLGTADYLTSDLTGKITSWTMYNEWGDITHNAVLKCGQRELDLVKNYTGHEYDQVLGLYYAKNRMYEPDNRRFTQIDPVRDSLNWYAYVGNNPVNRWDPLGLYFLIYDRETEMYSVKPYGWRNLVQDAVLSLAPAGGNISWQIEKLLFKAEGGSSAPSINEIMGDATFGGATKAIGYYMKLYCTEAAEAAARKSIYVISVTVGLASSINNEEHREYDDIAFKLLKNGNVKTSSKDADLLVKIMEKTYDYIFKEKPHYFVNNLEEQKIYKDVFSYHIINRRGADSIDKIIVGQPLMISQYYLDSRLRDNYKATKSSVRRQLALYSGIQGVYLTDVNKQSTENVFNVISNNYSRRYDVMMSADYIEYMKRCASQGTFWGKSIFSKETQLNMR